MFRFNKAIGCSRRTFRDALAAILASIRIDAESSGDIGDGLQCARHFTRGALDAGFWISDVLLH